MASAVPGALLDGLALGGVLAVGAAWSRSARSGALPHAGVGAAAAVGIAAAARASTLGRFGALAAALVAGAAAGAVAAALDAVATERLPRGMALLPDLVVLAALVAVADMLRPFASIAAPGPPLMGGGVPAAWMAAGLGLLAAAVVASGRARHVLPVLAAGAGAVAAALAGGAFDQSAPGLVALGGADPAGLALRTWAAALAARGSVEEAAMAGLALGVAEGLLRVADPTGSAGAVLAVAAGLAGLVLLLRRGRIVVPADVRSRSTPTAASGGGR